MSKYAPTRCDIEVSESDLPQVLTALRTFNLCVALCDTPSSGDLRSVAVWSGRREPATSVGAEAPSLLETLGRALEDRSLGYTLVDIETRPSPEQGAWWTVTYGDTGISTGTRVWGRTGLEVEVQLAGLAQFLGVDRHLFAATSDSDSAT